MSKKTFHKNSPLYIACTYCDWEKLTFDYSSAQEIKEVCERCTCPILNVIEGDLGRACAYTKIAQQEKLLEWRDKLLGSVVITDNLKTLLKKRKKQ